MRHPHLTLTRRARDHARPSRRARRRATAVTIALATAAVACAPDPTPTTVVPATSATLDGWNIQVVADDSGHDGSVVRFDWPGTATFHVRAPGDVDSLSLTVKGDQCDGAPAFTVAVDGLTIATDSADSSGWSTRTYHRPLLAGTHRVEVRYLDDHQSLGPQGCNRNLYVDRLGLSAATAPVRGLRARLPAGFVHQSGTQLLDGANRPLELRGVNLGGWLLWEGWMWGQGFDYVGQTAMLDNLTALVGAQQASRFLDEVHANFVTQDDFDALAHYGLNVARVPFNHTILEDDAQPGIYKPSGWAILDRVVAQAARAGVYVVLDLHAAPCSQTYAFISDWVPPSYLWTTPGCQDRTVNLWQAIAARYRNQPVIAGYDLLNETVAGDQELLELYRRITAAIRQVDPHHTLIYEGNDLARDFELMTEPLDGNQVLSAHDYPWMILGQDVTARLPALAAASTRLSSPMWVGEFGQSSYEEIDRYATLFDQQPGTAGWALWAWKQVPGNPSLQTIRHTPASRALIEWMTNPGRPRPTYDQAQQGMAEFVEAIRFVNTVPDARLQELLAR